MNTSNKNFKNQKKSGCKPYASRNGKGGKSGGFKDHVIKDGPVHELTSMNDPAWYGAETELGKATGSLPFSNLLGSYLGHFNYGPRAEQTFPGVMVLHLEPSLGGTNTIVSMNNPTEFKVEDADATAAPTVAARNLYAQTRKANSGATTYEAVDEYLYTVAWCSAASMIYSLQRAYGVVKHYSVRNRYYAETIVHAMGFDYDDMLINLPQYRALALEAAWKLNATCIPKGWNLLKRWKFLTSNAFVDSTGGKAQTIIPVFDSVLKWSGYTAETGTELIRVPVFTNEANGSGERPKIDYLRDLFNSILDPLYTDFDVSIMSGDIQKAFAEYERVDEIAEDYVVYPVYDESFNLQFHNMEFMGDLVSIEVGDEIANYGPALTNRFHLIYQFEGKIWEAIALDDAGINNRQPKATFMAQNPALLDCSKEQVTPGDAFEMTRWVAGGVEPVRATGQDFDRCVSLRSCGTEIPLYAIVYMCPIDSALYWASGERNNVYIPSLIYETNPLVNNVGNVQIDTLMSSVTPFRHHPRIYFTYAIDGGNYGYSCSVGETENYATVDRSVIERIHRIANLYLINTSAYTDIK